MQIILKNIDEEAIEKAVNEANLETLSCKFLPENNALVRAQLEIENEARKVFEEAYAVGSLVLPQAREEYVGLHSSESIERLPNEADKKNLVAIEMTTQSSVTYQVLSTFQKLQMNKIGIFKGMKISAADENRLKGVKLLDGYSKKCIATESLKEELNRLEKSIKTLLQSTDDPDLIVDLAEDQSDLQ